MDWTGVDACEGARMGAFDTPPGAGVGGAPPPIVAPEGCRGCSGRMPDGPELPREGLGTCAGFEVGTEGGGMGLECAGGGAGGPCGGELLGVAGAGLDRAVAGGGGARVALAVELLLPFSMGAALNLASVFRYCCTYIRIL